MSPGNTKSLSDGRNQNEPTPAWWGGAWGGALLLLLPPPCSELCFISNKEGIDDYRRTAVAHALIACEPFYPRDDRSWRAQGSTLVRWLSPARQADACMPRESVLMSLVFSYRA